MDRLKRIRDAVLLGALGLVAVGFLFSNPANALKTVVNAFTGLFHAGHSLNTFANTLQNGGNAPASPSPSPSPSSSHSVGLGRGHRDVVADYTALLRGEPLSANPASPYPAAADPANTVRVSVTQGAAHVL
jgi:hypothetical protein